LCLAHVGSSPAGRPHAPPRRAKQWACFAQGLTRTIVFTLLRSVGFKAARHRRGRDVADVRPQSSVPHPLHSQSLGNDRLDDEVDRGAVGGPCLVRPYALTPAVPPGSIRACGPLPIRRRSPSSPNTTSATISRSSLSSPTTPSRRIEHRRRSGGRVRCR